MTYYDPHPAHVLAGDAIFESRAKIVRKLFDQDDYCKRWYLAHVLVDEYTKREVYALTNKWEIEINSFDLTIMRANLTNFIAHNCVTGWVIEDTLANPAGRLPTSDVWGTE